RECSILIAQSGVYQSFVERIDRRSHGRELLRLITPAGPCICITKFSANLATRLYTPIHGRFEDLDRFVDPCLAHSSPTQTPTLLRAVRRHHFAVAYCFFVPAGRNEHVSQTVVALR